MAVRRRARRLQIESLESRHVLAAALVGVDFDATGFSPANWNTATATTTNLSGMIDETGATTTVALSISSDGTVSDAFATPPSFQIPIHPNALDNIDGNIYLATGTRLTLQWTNLTPGAQYDVYHFGSDEAPTNSQITIMGAGTPITFTRGYVANDLAINDQLGDDSRTLASYAKMVTATGGGTITITVDVLVGDAGTAGLAIQQQQSLVDGDFNDDGLWNDRDLDSLVSVIADHTHLAEYDLTGDGLVDLNDRDAWLSEAGAINIGPGRAYLVGDANLDGLVDGQDFITWNVHKFLSGQLWSGGDFNADGVTDGQDFIEWNNNKFLASDQGLRSPIGTQELELHSKFRLSAQNVSAALRINAVNSNSGERDNHLDWQMQHVFETLATDCAMRAERNVTQSVLRDPGRLY